MGIRSLILPTCKELAERLSSGAYDAAPWWVRLAVRWHLLRCELCRVYESQVRLLGKAYRASCGRDAAPRTLKDRLSQRLRRQD